MRITIAAVGRLKAGPERELFARYAERIASAGRPVGIAGLNLYEIDESRARRAEDRRAEEAQLLARFGSGDAFVALDERGRDVTSEDFAVWLRARRDAATEVTFLIGGPDGLDPKLMAPPATRFRFGAMTLPHGLVRVLLAEQIYRAVTILVGHPYHRGSMHRDD